MAGEHAAYAKKYLQNTQSVVFAGRRLLDALDEGPATLAYAIDGLEDASQEHEAGGTGYRAFMFASLDAAPPADKATRERMTEDALAAVLTDVQVANVLLAAGHTLGETGEKVPPSLLEGALTELETTRQSIEQPLTAPLVGVQPGRFGFLGATAAAEPVVSPDVPSAIEAFRRRAQDTLAALVIDAQGTVSTVMKALDKLDKQKVLEALSRLGDQVQELPRVGRLFRRGVETLSGAIHALGRLLGGEIIARIKDRVEKLWQDAKAGKLVAQGLEYVFGVEATKKQVEDIMRLDGLDRGALDQASTSLQALSARFKENMAMAKNLTSAVTLAGTLLGLASLAAPSFVLLTAVAYLVIVAAVVLIGADYADSGSLLQRVRGVGQIAASLRPA